MPRAIHPPLRRVAVCLAFAPGLVLAATQPVRVTNTAADPVPVVVAPEPAPEFAQRSGSATFPAGSTFVQATMYTVPVGKRLVMEYFTGYGPAGNQVTYQIRATLGGFSTTFYVPPDFDSRFVSETVHIVADSGTSVVLTTLVNHTQAGNSGVRYSFSGRLIDMP